LNLDSTLSYSQPRISAVTIGRYACPLALSETRIAEGHIKERKGKYEQERTKKD